MVDLNELEEYAVKNNVPIMQKDGIEFLIDLIKKNNVKKILEIGTAIGYSAIKMASVDNDIIITSIERDNERYLQAVKNVKKYGYENQIHLIDKDALDIKLSDSYDLIFIDAAKAQNIKFFEKFCYNLNDGGFIVTDNLSFHGYVEKKEEEIESKNIRGLVRKVKEYIKYLKENSNWNTIFYDVGDGISVTYKKDV